MVRLLVFVALVACSSQSPIEPPAREGTLQGGDAGWETAAYVVSLGGTRHGTLRLFGNRYEYEGDASPEAFGAPFYFMVHATGALDTAQNDSGHSTVGLVRFDPEGADFNSMDPRRTLQIRRDDSVYWMHSIVSEFQNWTIRAE